MSTELKTLNGYSFDATKLGGLDAKYYAQGRAAHNLLDNSDFRNPVNQRGKTSYTANGHTIDRWRDTTNMTLNVNNGSISLVNNSSSSNAYLRQRISVNALTAGIAYTMAINIDGTIYMGYAVIASDNTVTFYGKDGLYLSCTGLTSNSYWTIQIAISAGYSFSNVRWAALYEGSYTADTLPAYVPKDNELEECQRYYYQTWTGSEIGANGIITRQSMAPSRLASVDLPTTMRTTPTITLYNSSGTAGAVKDWNTSEVVSGMTVTYANSKSFVPANESSGLTAGNWYGFHYAASADL